MEPHVPAYECQGEDQRQHRDAARDSMKRPIGEPRRELIGRIGDCRADQTGDEDGTQEAGEGAHQFKVAKTRLAAAMVASMSACVCAADKNPASNADGAK